MYYNILGDVCATPKSYSIAIDISMTSHQSLAPLSGRIETILSQLQQVYPNATYELDWETPLELLVATILAAQCTDERVNQVTKTLFPKYPNAAAYAAAELSELEQDLKQTGFYRKKAQTVQNVCQVLLERFDGAVPQTMERLVELPGVARKTANVVLNCAFSVPSGVIVDTHVARVSQRMGLSGQKNPDKIEQDLMKLVPQSDWIFFGPAMVLHGRYTCTASNPQCSQCKLVDVCEQKI
jgi:endonuclease III